MHVRRALLMNTGRLFSKACSRYCKIALLPACRQGLRQVSPATGALNGGDAAGKQETEAL